MNARYTTMPLVAGLFTVTFTGAQFGFAQEPSRSPSIGVKPNVIVVLADDQGYGDMSHHGNDLLKTPNLDRFFGQSTELSNFHVSVVCTPTRAAMLTGMDPGRLGIRSTCGSLYTMRADVDTLADVFSRNNYQTALFGKWHLGDNYPFRPVDRGFQHSLNFGGWQPTCIQNRPFMVDGWDDQYLENGQYKQFSGYVGAVWFDEAQKWMRQQQKQQQPFFLYLATNEPHAPWTWLDKSWWGKYSEKTDWSTANFYGTIAHLDTKFGELEQFLQSSGLKDNTIVVYASDNGTARGHKYYNAGLRGRKTKIYEGGHRVPCAIRWPAGGIGKNKLDMPCSQVDLFPTLLALCRITFDNADLDGDDISAFLRDQSTPFPDRMISTGLYWGSNPNPYHQAVIWNKWRLVHGNQLFDMETDWGQQNDVAAAHPRIVEKMRAHLDQKWQSIAPYLQDVNRVVIGHAKENPMLLTAFDWGESGKPDEAVTDQRHVRDGVRRNGIWRLRAGAAGNYQFKLYRWPPEMKVALAGAPREEDVQNAVRLPIHSAAIELNGRRRSTIDVGSDDSHAAFELELQPGDVELKTYFFDRDGNEICGAYYVVVKRKITH